MEIHLENQQEAYVRAAVASGRFSSPDDAVNDVLRQAQDQEIRLAALRADVKAGLDDLADGRFTEYDEAGLTAFFQDVHDRGMKRLQLESQSISDEG